MHFLDCVKTIVDTIKMKGPAAEAEVLKDIIPVRLARPDHPPAGVGADFKAPPLPPVPTPACH